VSELGARRVEVVARRPAGAAPLVALGEALGILVTAGDFAHAAQAPAEVSPVAVTIATLPGGTDPGPGVESLAARGGLLMDVVYGHWPTPLSQAWDAAGSAAVSGLGMLLHQALLQVRVFVAGDPRTMLEREDDVLAAMRHALVGD
jgi:shikimate dehydrogenase